MAVVAARQWRSPAFGRRTPVRRYRIRLAAVCGPVLALVFGLDFRRRARYCGDDPRLGAGLHLQPDPAPAETAASAQ